MDLLRDEVIQYLERETGRDIQYSSVSPSILRYLDIRDMRILSQDQSKTPILAINRIRVYYNVFTLLGKHPNTAFNRVSIEDSELVVDLDQDKDLIELVDKLIEIARSRELKPDIVISGRNLSVGVINSKISVFVNRLFFDIDTGREIFAIELNGNASLESPEYLASFGTVKTTLDISGSVSQEITEASMRISFSEIISESASLAKQTFQLSLSEGSWKLTKIQDRLPIDFTITYDTNLNIALAQYTAADFMPESLLMIHDPDAPFSEWMNTEITGNGEIRYFMETRELAFSGYASATLPIEVGPFSNVQISGVFQGDPQVLHLSNIQAVTEFGLVGFDGTIALEPFIPQGTLTVKDFTWPLDRPVSGSLSVLERDGTYQIEEGSLDIDGVQVDGIRANAILEDQGVTFSLSCAIDHDSPLTVEGSFDTTEGTVLEASANIKALPLESILAQLGELSLSIPDDILSMKIDTDAFIRTDFDRFSFSVPAFRAYGDGDEYGITAKMSGNNSAVNIMDVDVSWGGIRVTGNAEVVIDDAEALTIKASLGAFGQTYAIAGSLRDGKNLSFSGDYGLLGTAELDGKTVSITIQSDALPVPFREQVYYVSMDASGYYVNTDTWRFDSKSTTIYPVPLLTLGDARIGFAGTAEPGAITAKSVTLIDQFSEISGPADIKYQLNPERSLSGTITLKDTDQREQYELSFAMVGDAVEAEARFEEALLERIGDLPISGRISGAAKISGSLSSPNIEALVSLANGTLGGDNVSLQASVSLDQGRLEISDLSADYLSNRLTNAQGALSFTDGGFSLSAEYTGSIKDRLLKFNLGVNGAFADEISRAELMNITKMDFTTAIFHTKLLRRAD